MVDPSFTSAQSGDNLWLQPPTMPPQELDQWCSKHSLEDIIGGKNIPQHLLNLHVEAP